MSPRTAFVTDHDPFAPPRSEIASPSAQPHPAHIAGRSRKKSSPLRVCADDREHGNPSRDATRPASGHVPGPNVAVPPASSFGKHVPRPPRRVANEPPERFTPFTCVPRSWPASCTPPASAPPHHPPHSRLSPRARARARSERSTSGPVRSLEVSGRKTWVDSHAGPSRREGRRQRFLPPLSRTGLGRRDRRLAGSYAIPRNRRTALERARQTHGTAARPVLLSAQRTGTRCARLGERKKSSGCTSASPQAICASEPMPDSASQRPPTLMSAVEPPVASWCALRRQAAAQHASARGNGGGAEQPSVDALCGLLILGCVSRSAVRPRPGELIGGASAESEKGCCTGCVWQDTT
ncbi:hypothetical protein BD310DRAFT_953419 [Dichomitus squalens]|uniref:Uncharacterized protein n=1 Tax=Dichomitus squalens TaxID=114155 RepID=A0A4Q9PDK1_9APHY|nr:hypothetical protein BD310DRAFT_953419 [Dichomitus squalens]